MSARTKTSIAGRIFPVPIVAVAIAFVLADADAEAGFSKRKSITIDRTKVGEASTTTLSSYPMLFSVTDNDLKTTGNGGDVTDAQGDDIIFRALDTTTCGGASVCTLDHEIEKYDGSTGELVAWVRLPSVNAQNAGSNTVIYIYYGNSSITTSTERKTSVWDSNFKCVYHLKESSGGSGALKDSTSNNNHLTDTNSPTLGASGQVDGNVDLDGNNDYLEASSSSSIRITGTNITLSAWVRYQDTLSEQIVIAHPYQTGSHNSPYFAYSLHILRSTSTTRYPRFWLSLNGSGTAIQASTTISADAWAYLVGVYDGSYMRIYIDAVERGSTYQTVGISDYDTPLRIGCNGGPGEYFKHNIDEVRISNTNRTLAWIKTEYNNMNSPSTFYTVGSEESSFPSAVGFSSMGANAYPDGVAVVWETGWEHDNLGFHIWRERDGERVRLTGEPIAGSALDDGASARGAGGRSYCSWDAEGSEEARYFIEDLDLSGARAMAGPLAPQVCVDPKPAVVSRVLSEVGRDADPRAQGVRRRLAVSRMRNRPSLAAVPRFGDRTFALPPRLGPGGRRGNPGMQWALAGEGAIKLGVREDGWYRVTQRDLLDAGLDPSTDPRHLRLLTEGVEQAMSVWGSYDRRLDPEDAIEFYGVGADTPWTDTRTYWLSAGSRPGRRILAVKFRGPGRESPASFPSTVERKDRTVYFAALQNGEADNFFGPVLSTLSVDQVLEVVDPDPSWPGETSLEVSLQGATASEHRIRVLVNDVAIGEIAFEGQELRAFGFALDRGALIAGDNLVTLVPEGPEGDVCLLESVRLTYGRLYRAKDDELRCTAAGGEWLTVGGFTNPAIRVIDVTDPERPWIVRGDVGAGGGGYAIRLKVPQAGVRTLLALAGDRARDPVSIERDEPSAWHAEENEADLVLLAPADLRDALAPLAAWRSQRGWRVAVVGAEDVYDEFGYGRKSPGSIQGFLAHASHAWRVAPRFLILAGDASFDPRDRLALGAPDLLPAKTVATETLETASDDWYGDLDGDGLAEIAVGRLPVRTAAELSEVVEKLIAYDSAPPGLWSSEALFIADVNGGYDFEAATRDLESILTGRWEAREIFRGRDADPRTVLLARWDEGASIVHYIGHGSVGVWSGGLFSSEDAHALGNGARLPFVVAMTCLNGFFHDAYAECLGEALVRAERGGAIAAWASSGLTPPETQEKLDRALLWILAERPDLTIGEAVREAKRSVADADLRLTWILFGDPTTRLR